MSQGFAQRTFELTDAYGFEVENTPMGEQRVAAPVRLAGAVFEGTTVDSNFWTATTANAATISQTGGQVTLDSGVNAAGSAKLASVRRARYTGGAANQWRGFVQLDSGIADNTRIWGAAWGATMPTVTDGFYFQLSGTTFSVVILKGGAPTTINSGSFNGDYGASYSLTTDNTEFEIYWTPDEVTFVIEEKVLHRYHNDTGTLANTCQHHVYLSNINSGSTTSKKLYCRLAIIRRLGLLVTQPTSKYQSGTTAGLVLKYGTGNLHGLVVSGVANNSVITLYDNTAASGTVLWSSGSMGALTTPFALDFQDLPFFTGLTLEIASANSNVTVIYE